MAAIVYDQNSPWQHSILDVLCIICSSLCTRGGQQVYCTEALGVLCIIALRIVAASLQGNLAKQLAKLVKVKYVEDISTASRVGASSSPHQ